MISPASYGAPVPDLAFDHFDVVPRAYARAAVGRLGRATQTPQQAEFHRQVLSPLEAAVRSGAACWQPELGAALLALQRGKVELALVQTALGLHAHGGSAEWRFAVPEPTTLSFAGYRFDLHGEIHVEGDAQRLEIALPTGRRLAFASERDGWRLRQPHGEAAPAAAPAFMQARGFEDRYVVDTPPADDDSADYDVPWPPPPSRESVDAIAPLGAAETDEALDLICSLGDAYRSWMTPLFRGIASSRRRSETVTKSSSSPSQPGVINVALPVGGENLGSILIHEMSHQYYSLTNFVTPLCNGRDETVYYSSLKRLPRNIDRILLALHATANMSLYWSDLIERLGETPERRERLDVMLEHTRYMGGLADGSCGLTQAGRELWEVQKAALRTRGVGLDA